ncbi:unnamed protein product [Durusdinium trenchii]|uniref:Uncharacterized protein n=1 Tax=Durusdinium trenchii TaxID=1381693 RepID=A0ABP0KIP6_9DINO
MGGLPSRFVPSYKGIEKQSHFALQQDGVPFERNIEPFEVELNRSQLEAWGLAWNLARAGSFQVAGVDPCSPAGRWNQQQQAFGRCGICRGDELFEVNDSSDYSTMSQELAVSRTVRLLFRPGSNVRTKASNLKHLVKNAFLHIDTTDPEPDPTDQPDEPRRLSLSDPLPFVRPSQVDEADEDALSDASEASFYSMKSSSSSLSSSSQCSQHQPSSGRSCPSTDWEFQGYQCHNGQMLPPFSRSVSSGHVSTSSSGRGKRRRRASAANVVPPAPMPSCQVPNQLPNALVPNQVPNQMPFPPTMVPVMVPVVGAPPFLAMAAPALGPLVSPLVPASVGVAVPFPSCKQPDMPMGPPMPTQEVETTVSQPCWAAQNLCAPNSSRFEQSCDHQDGAGCSRAPEPAQLEPAAPSFATFEETDTQKEIVEETSVLKDQKSAEGAPVKPRKRPTRRGGKRARHRPCHAAEWASSVGSAETPSFGEPGSGEEAEGEEAEEGEDEKEELKEELRDASAPRSFEKKDLKRRSFYPLAARLRLAAGLKPKGLEESKTAFGSAKIFSNHIQPKADVSKDGSVLPGPKVPPVSTLPNPIEVIEEVEPEPASASDVSDLPKQEPAEELAAGTIPEPLAPHRVIDLPSDQVVGRRVQIIGLTKTLEFNDLWGKVEHFDSSCKRFAVQLLPAEGVPMTVKLRGENLRMPPVLSLSFKDASGKQANAWQPNLRAVSCCPVHT